MIHYNKRFIIYHRFLTIYLKAISTLQTNIKIKHINYILRLNVLKIAEYSSNLKEYLFKKKKELEECLHIIRDIFYRN